MQQRWFLAGTFYWTTIFLLFLGITSPGQDKKPLDHDAYDIWNIINERAISPNGLWVMFSFSPEAGDATLRIEDLRREASYTFRRGVQANFTSDSRFAVFLIRAPKDSIKLAEREKRDASNMPEDSLGIVNLITGNIVKFPRVKSFEVPREGGNWIACHLEEPPAKSDSAAVPEAKPQFQKNENRQEEGAKKEKAQGSELILRNNFSGEERRYANVTDYQFSKNGNWLIFTAASKDSTADGIYAVVVETGEFITILNGAGDYKQLVLDKKGEQVAFVSNRDDFRSHQPTFKLYYWSIEDNHPQSFTAEITRAIPAEWWVSEYGKLSFSEDGKRLFFGTAPRPDPQPQENLPEDQPIELDIWHWKDPYIQPMQLKQLEEELRRSYTAVIDLKKKKALQLATEDIPEVAVGDKGDADIALGLSNMPYRQLISWDYPEYYDIYLIDVTTGERRQVLKKLQSRPQLSPEAKYLTWWEGDSLAWFAMDVKKGLPLNISAQIPYPLKYHLYDRPAIPPSYGQAGWLEKDRRFLVYDQHDIWALDPEARDTPENITRGLGRKKHLRFRYVKLDPERDAIDPEAPLLLSAFNWQTRAAGFYEVRVDGEQPPQELIMMERAFSTPEKARDADVLLYTRSSFQEFPDLWVSDPRFQEARKISDVNPQQSQYLWGTVELFRWTSLDSIPLEGLLFKPENFDPQRRYPMIVRFYEKDSNKLHKHRPPQANRSVIIPTFYTSRGYLVFMPDVHYKTGYPGESAYNCVIPGVRSLAALPWVEEENIGLQGHSWGGYQIAYLLTKTNLFKAAEAGAPVADMISAYGGIRWESGMSRMFQYEKEQSRLGASLWENPQLYLENSPIFKVDKIQTPLLILHNDQDGAVPWSQGIELFLALRRLGKPAWLINYNQEPHWPVEYRKKVDWQKRLQQYFDHYLKDAPAPRWLVEGIPAVEKGKTLGLEPAAPQ